MDPLERKAAVDRILRLSDKLDELDEFDPDHRAEDERIRHEMDIVWNELDDIAQIQADPMRAKVDKNMRVVDRRVVDKGDHARFLGRIYDPQLDEWDELDTLVSWRRLDHSDPRHYAEVSEYWDIARPQDMEEHDSFWTLRKVHGE